MNRIPVEVIYEALEIKLDPRFLPSIRHLSWDEFWIIFYRHIYNYVHMPENFSLLAYQRTKDGVFDALERRMAQQIRQRKRTLTFHRVLYWRKYSREIHRYNSFLEQIESGKLQFDRFYSGSFDPNVCITYLDHFVSLHILICQYEGKDPTAEECAIAELKFTGPGTPLFNSSDSLLGDFDQEVIIDPLDVWKIEKYRQERFIYRGVPIINHKIQLKEEKP